MFRVNINTMVHQRSKEACKRRKNKRRMVKKFKERMNMWKRMTENGGAMQRLIKTFEDISLFEFKEGYISGTSGSGLRKSDLIYLRNRVEVNDNVVDAYLALLCRNSNTCNLSCRFYDKIIGSFGNVKIRE